MSKRSDLQAWRDKAQELIDGLWMHRRCFNRREAYEWLATKLEIPAADCRIDRLNEQQCKRVVSLCCEMYQLLEMA